MTRNITNSVRYIPLLFEQRFWNRSGDAPSKVCKQSIWRFDSVGWKALIQLIMDAQDVSADKDGDVVGVDRRENDIF